ncbi:MAG: serine acetyltransferase [Saprospiraceae bacterium]|nr:serine acetyltransferase [Saprospiraceae bacterium]
MEQQFLEVLYQAHQHKKTIPSPKDICHFIKGVLQILFPELSDNQYDSFKALEQEYRNIRLRAAMILKPLVLELTQSPDEIEHLFFTSLPHIRARLLSDASAISLGDPAATSQREVIRTYPGFFAIAVYRLAHEFYNLGVPLIPRILTEYAHGETGIDIHPAAEIGDNFCIDHGTGIVIGETVKIGNHVKLYQGVTLGALSVKKEMAKTKRHPTIEDEVIIYAGATILGGETVIGSGSIIGGNVWITKSVPPFSRVYYQGHFEQKEEVILV